MGKKTLSLRLLIVLLSFAGLVACTKIVIGNDSTDTRDDDTLDDAPDDAVAKQKKLFYYGSTPPISLYQYEQDFEAFIASIRQDLLATQAVAHHQAPKETPEGIIPEETISDDDIIIDDTLLAQESGSQDTIDDGLIAQADGDKTLEFIDDDALNDDGTISDDVAPLALLALLENKPDEMLYETVQATYYHYLGWEHAGLGNYSSAIQYFQRTLHYEPENAVAYNSIGVARVNLGDVGGAIDDYSQAIIINPYYSSAFHNRGKARAEVGDYDGAVEDYRKALQLNVNVGLLYLDRATAEYMRGNYANALKDVQKALELGAENTQNLLDKIQSQQL